MKLSIKQTIDLQDKITITYGDTEKDIEIIRALCFARNIAEVVADHFEKTHNKTEFYKSILNDKSISFSVGYEAVKKEYGYLLNI